MSKNVGDTYGTSRFNPADPPAEAPYEPHESALGITSSAYAANMAKLIARLSVR
ncbi:hypothetical protein [Streptomyces sp. NBC_00057]|uniref:hypothetical protein n=1 Tax=Streptomyces sp. NBC_00057 TaxID=2975634 RepID=UPI00324AEA1D